MGASTETPRTDGPSRATAMFDELAHALSQPLAAIVSYARGCQVRANTNNLAPQDLSLAMDEIAREALRVGELLRGFRETMAGSAS